MPCGARATRRPWWRASPAPVEEPPRGGRIPRRRRHSGKRVLMFDKLKDLGGLMQQAQAMQQKMQELQATLERLEIVGSSGAGLVKVTVNGKNETRKVEIDASLFVPADKGVVEDLIVAAANDATDQGRADGAGADARHHRRPAAASGLQAVDERSRNRAADPVAGPAAGPGAALGPPRGAASPEEARDPDAAARRRAGRRGAGDPRLLDLRQSRHDRSLLDLRRSQARPGPDLRRRGCRRPVGHGARQDLPRPLSRAGRLAVGARRHRAGRAQHRRPGQARGGGRRCAR